MTVILMSDPGNRKWSKFVVSHFSLNLGILKVTDYENDTFSSQCSKNNKKGLQAADCNRFFNQLYLQRILHQKLL